MKAKGCVFRDEIRLDPKFSYVMVSGPDGLLIELFQTHEPQRWEIRLGVDSPNGSS
jgi:hypothetical protein